MKSTVLSIIIAIGILSVGVYFINYLPSVTAHTPKKVTTQEQESQENIPNVSIVNGKQIVEVKARGGYSPRLSTAKTGIPTILRFKTNGTFDCSSSISIPSMNISKILPNTGTTDIDLGIQKEGVFQGTCGMGMYQFAINFQK